MTEKMDKPTTVEDSVREVSGRMRKDGGSLSADIASWSQKRADYQALPEPARHAVDAKAGQLHDQAKKSGYLQETIAIKIGTELNRVGSLEDAVDTVALQLGVPSPKRGAAIEGR